MFNCVNGKGKSVKSINLYGIRQTKKPISENKWKWLQFFEILKRIKQNILNSPTSAFVLYINNNNIVFVK